MRRLLVLFVLLHSSFLWAQPGISPQKEVNGVMFYVHTVEDGNSLWGLQRVYGVEIEEILKFNPGLTEGLSLGQEIVIPVSDFISPQTVTEEYKVKKGNMEELLLRTDIIPTSIALAQAAKETGWGTSRFAQEGNALFGQWTWSGEGLKPKEAEEGADHKVMKFNILQASVRAHQRNLNTHPTYKDLRKARAEFRDSNKPLDSLELSNYLNKYAETGNQYVEVLQQIIKQNNLKDFDDAKLLPSSSDLESLI